MFKIKELLTGFVSYLMMIGVSTPTKSDNEEEELEPLVDTVTIDMTLEKYKILQGILTKYMCGNKITRSEAKVCEALLWETEEDGSVFDKPDNSATL